MKNTTAVKTTIALLFSFLILFSFSSFAQTGKKLLKKVPKNAVFVMTFDGESLTKKLDVNQIKEMVFYKNLQEQAMMSMGDKATLFTDALLFPEKIGIDSKSSSFIYYTLDTVHFNPEFGYLINLSSKKKFEAFVKEMSKEEYKNKVKKKSGYHYIADNGMFLAWNKKVMFLSNYQQYNYYNYYDMSESDPDSIAKAKIKKSLHTKSKNSILKQKDFQEYISGKRDIGFWVNYSGVLNQAWSSLLFMATDSIPMHKEDHFKDHYLHFNLDFNKGDISMSSSYRMDDKIADIAKAIYSKKANPDLLKYLPNEHLLGLASFCVDAKEIQKQYQKNFSAFSDELEKEIVKAIYDKDIDNDKFIVDNTAKVDSIYKELYKPDTSYTYNYDYMNYSDSTKLDIPYYSDTVDYSSLYDSTVVGDTTSYYEQNNDYVSDTSTYSSYDYNYTYVMSHTDSLYAIIDSINLDINDRRKELLEQKIGELKLRDKDYWDLFEGDFVFAVTDFYYVDKKYTTYEMDDNFQFKEVEKVKKEPFPEFVMLGTADNTAKVNSLLGELESKGYLLKKGRYYEIVPGNNKCYLGLMNKVFIVSNNEKLFTETPDGIAPDKQITGALKSEVLQKPGVFYMDIQNILKEIPSDSLNYTQVAFLQLYSDRLKSLTVFNMEPSGNESKSNLVFEFTNKIDYSLTEIFRLIDETYKISTGQK